MQNRAIDHREMRVIVTRPTFYLSALAAASNRACDEIDSRDIDPNARASARPEIARVHSPRGERGRGVEEGAA